MASSGPGPKYTQVSLPQDGSVQRGQAGFLAPGQTQVMVNVDDISVPSAVTYYIPLPQPPAGKTWYVSDLSFTHDQTTGQRFAVTSGGCTLWSTQCHGSLAPDIIPGMESQIVLPQLNAPVLNILGASSMHAWANISGFQQNSGPG